MGEGDGNTGMINIGPILLGMPRNMGIIRHILRHDGCEAQRDRRKHEKVFVTLLRRPMQLMQTKESFLEETAFEQSSGRIFANWEETVTSKGDRMRGQKGDLICFHLKCQPSLQLLFLANVFQLS